MNERLVPLANVARDLSDEDLQECVIFAAYLTYRRRVFGLASSISQQKSEIELCPRAPANGPHSWYESGDGTLCEHCGTRRQPASA